MWYFMDLNSITTEVDQFIRNQGGYWGIPWLLAAITEELGELSRALQIFTGIRPEFTSTRKNSLKKSIEEETGDLFFALICLTNSYNIDLGIAVINTLKKYKSRDIEKKT
jgi:NTP pyrophosphatase (non-canonical NTP hydrolase)